MEIILKKCEETPKCDLKIMMYFKESTLDKLDESVRKIIFEEMFGELDLFDSSGIRKILL